MARGFYQKEGINSEETLQEVRYTSFRTIMVVSSMMNYRQAFLNGMIEEEFYIE